MNHWYSISTCFTISAKGPEYEHATPTNKGKENISRFQYDYTTLYNNDWNENQNYILKWFLECPGEDWECYRGCKCDIWKNEYCDKLRGVCMRVKSISFRINYTLSI